MTPTLTLRPLTEMWKRPRIARPGDAVEASAANYQTVEVAVEEAAAVWSKPLVCSPKELELYKWRGSRQVGCIKTVSIPGKMYPAVSRRFLQISVVRPWRYSRTAATYSHQTRGQSWHVGRKSASQRYRGRQWWRGLQGREDWSGIRSS